ncbi:cytochrome b [Cellvibrio sp.]|uniref:cytochrome b n=1 Tax=Cellvibrio sp. TaxID=1965322 RepID=UPI0039647859
MLKDSKTGYGLISIIFHWACAPLILFVFGLGVYMRGLDYYSPWYHRGPEIHIELGLLIFFLMVLRLLWRLRSGSPEAIATIPKSNQLAANLVKLVIYIAVFTICITGYLITTAEGSGANFFGIFNIPTTLELSADNIDRAGKIHKYVAWGLIALVALHATAALFHHFIKRDKTLVRMLKPSDDSL